ncbi:TetR/AcrR family transcriptional regulator [Cohnella nanjingensis]|uniref:TetR/AcrR family transcriptional regulator n=1 Tax=Cohnella nanjingensis TaxID=1387779 RepID=A0A7X0RMN3_9BACL|nr:TetR/AcrR family transcriptional regulator [Cohnella nanjingensis]MBB6670347.1 TetR/AcrR family transcriptional regulator [Cohnella nanjingensis]
MGKLDASEEKENRDAEYHRRIQTAAARLLEQNGIDSVNMYQIAQEAGIGQGTLYRRYEHPGEIYSEMLRNSTEQILGELEAEADQFRAADASASALDQLEHVLSRLFDYVDSQIELLTSISCMYAGKKNFLPHKRPITVRLYGILNVYLVLAAERREVRDIDVTLTSNFLMAVLSPEQYMYHRDSLGYTKEQYLAGIRSLYIEGIRAPKVKAEPAE